MSTEDLRSALTKVPSQMLIDEIRRRNRARLSKNTITEVEDALEKASQVYDVPKILILGNLRDENTVAARWAFYRALHDIGLTTWQISSATNHHVSRIYYAFEKMNLTPNTNKK